MIILLQLIKMLTKDQREGLFYYLSEPDEGFENADLVDDLPDFLFNHYGLGIELTDSQKSSMLRILDNGNYKHAFNLTKVIA